MTNNGFNFLYRFSRQDSYSNLTAISRVVLFVEFWHLWGSLCGREISAKEVAASNSACLIIGFSGCSGGDGTKIGTQQ